MGASRTATTKATDRGPWSMTEARGAPTNQSVAAKDVVPLGAVRPSRDDPPRVLIVDNDPLLSNVVSRYLQRHGLETEWASDGPAAVAAVEKDRPDSRAAGRDVAWS